MEQIEAMQRTPKLSEGVIVNEDPETPSLLNPMTGEIYITNKIGKVISDLADGTRTVKTIGETITGRFVGAKEEVVFKETQDFLNDCVEKGLMSWV
jgi:hypothetical protein